MISLNALSSRRSPIGEVLRQVVRGCSSRRTMYHQHRSFPFSACDSQSIGPDKPNEVCLSTKDATSIVGCNSGLHAGKRSEGKVSLPLCSLTIWYYRYALTLHIDKPDPAYAWHSELNTSLGTTTRNHDSEPTKSIRYHGYPIIQDLCEGLHCEWTTLCSKIFHRKHIKFVHQLGDNQNKSVKI